MKYGIDASLACRSMNMMTNPFPERLQKYLVALPEFKVFVDKIDKLEEKMTNRIPAKLGIVCRWIKVKQKTREIRCEYGQGEPGLLYCLQCSGCLFNLQFVYERFKEMDYYSRKIRPSETSDVEGMEKSNKEIYIEKEARLVDHLKDTLKEKLRLLDKIENGEEVDFCE